MQTTQVLKAYSMGLYETYEKFWDDLQLEKGVPFNKTLRFKRVCLYPYFKQDVYLLPPFTITTLYLKYIVNGNVVGLERIRKELEVRKERQRKIDRVENLNKKFIEFFGDKNAK